MSTDPFLLLPPQERKLYIEQAAIATGKGVFIFEKDFWVCWILKALFNLPEFMEHLTFKGGSTLSKAYGVISRFSEDLDLSFHRSFLGFGGDQDPEKATSSNKRTKGLENLQAASIALVKEHVLPSLRSEIGNMISEKWSLELDTKDPQTIFSLSNSGNCL